MCAFERSEKGMEFYMDEYIEEKTTYTIDNQEYTVIARCKKDNNIEKIYEILSRYALQKINNN